MPTAKRVSDIKANLLNPATTSHFEVLIDKPVNITSKYMEANGLVYNQGKLNLMCSEATLPGSNLATLELTNDHTGVTERHAYRRVYDDRIDLTFYVDAENYLPIRFFETWIKYISQESIADSGERGAGIDRSNYFYRFAYRDDYASDGLEVIKFEKSMMGGAKGIVGSPIRYKFVKAYPISISSMPVAYDSSSLLKCTVSITYMRYYIDKAVLDGDANINNRSPQELARINSLAFNPETNLGIDYGDYTTTGGIPLASALSSGNTINVRTAFGGESILS